MTEKIAGYCLTISKAIDKIEAEQGKKDNGVEWAMMLAEYPHIFNSDKEEENNIFSCRQFEAIKEE